MLTKISKFIFLLINILTLMFNYQVNKSNYLLNLSEETIYEWGDQYTVNYIGNLFIESNYPSDKKLSGNNWVDYIMLNKQFSPDNIIKFNDIYDSVELLEKLGYLNNNLKYYLNYYSEMYKNNNSYQYFKEVKIEFDIIGRFWGPNVNNQKTALVIIDVKIIKNFSVKLIRTICSNFNVHKLNNQISEKKISDIILTLKQSSLKIKTDLNGQEVFDKLKIIQSQEELIVFLKKISWNKVFIKNNKFIGLKIQYLPLKYILETNQIEIQISILHENSKLIAHNVFVLEGFGDNGKIIQKTVDDFYEKFIKQNNLNKKNKIIYLNDNSIYKKYLPSLLQFKLEKELEIHDLKNFNLVLDNSKIIKMLFKIIRIDDKDGEIEIFISFSLNQYQKNLKLIVKGFINKIQQDKIDINNLKSYLEDKYKDVQIQDNSDDKKLLPSEIKEQLKSENLTQKNIERLGIEILNEKTLKEATVNYKIVSANDRNGQLVVQVEIIQGRVSDNFTFQIKGFQTESQRNQIAVNKALAKFNKANPNPTIDKTSDLATKTVEEANYKVGTILSGNLLNRLNLVVENEDLELDWEFKVKAIDNENGILIVEVTITKNFSQVKSDITINGFLKKI